jgi:hypothetical protein
MTTSSSLVASAALSGLMVFGAAAGSGAQPATGLPQPVDRLASIAPGSIQGLVRDEAGRPVSGVMISALGATTSFVFTGDDGRFELAALPPGPYLIRAYLRGFQTPRPAMVDVR